MYVCDMCAVMLQEGRLVLQHHGQTKCNLVSSPGLLMEGGEGRNSTHCMCMCHYYSDFNDQIIYRYLLVYLPFDLNTSYSSDLEMADLDSLSFKRDLGVPREVFMNASK